MMPMRKRRTRQSKFRNYEFILQWLRYALATKTQIIHVVAIRSSKDASVSNEFPNTDVIIQLPKFPERGP
jgi:hypothetical protein